MCIRNCFVIISSMLLLLCTSCNKEEKSDGNVRQTSLKTVTIDEVFSNPSKYETPVRMTGKVIRIDSTSSTVFLGCEEDACIVIPVRYKGTVPSVGALVLAVGQVEKIEGKYVFAAKQVQMK